MSIRAIAFVTAAVALAGCTATETARDVTVGADGLHQACAEVIQLARYAELIPGAGAIAQGVLVGCATADGLARLAAEPSSVMWLGMQAQMLRDLLDRARVRGMMPVPRASRS